jgi:superfamily I DNA and RNA helicase
MAEEIPEGWKYDSLIIDEGQDFEADWFEILRLFLREGGNILWLDDPDQNLQDKRPVPMQGFVRYCSRVNYRSPESIANFISDTLPIPFEQGNPLPGLGVAVHTYTAPAEQPKIVVKAVQNLVQRGFSHDDIVVLTCRGVQGSVFSQLDTIGGVGLRHFTGEYDSQGRQIMTQGKLTFESIYRFKGQEAPAVILVDVDPRAERREREERLLFCGMTRATVRLELVVNRENDDNRRFIGKTT